MDIGSTHNFLALSAAKKLGCKLKKTVPLEVSMANGNHMLSEYMCENFQWSLHGSTYSTDVMVIPLGSWIWYWVFSGYLLWVILCRISKN